MQHGARHVLYSWAGMRCSAKRAAAAVIWDVDRLLRKFFVVLGWWQGKWRWYLALDSQGRLDMTVSDWFVKAAQLPLQGHITTSAGEDR
jgi:hypothetical protein